MVKKFKMAASLAAFLSVSVMAKPIVKVQVDPSTVRNGEDVTFTIQVENLSNVAVAPPTLPLMPDWQVMNSSQASDLSSTIQNGKISSKYTYQFSYMMRAKRTGNLQIPPFKIRIGNEVWSTIPVDVAVEQLGQHDQPLDADEDALGGIPGGTAPPNLFSDIDTFPVPERETFFLRAEPSKTTVYEGELIVLSFALYQRNVDLSNAELDKFPDFKGFLKEDLFIPKTWDRRPVIMKGERFLRTELVRYAIFSLQPGQQQIGQLVFRADVTNSMSSILGSLMSGRPLPGMGAGPIPMTKSNPMVTITSKPLPPVPAGMRSFTGGIGQFHLSSKVPSDRLSVEQPFTIEMQIRGRGNLKTMEAPELDLPPEFEVVDTKNIYKFNEDATGFKTFEYLVLPKKEGQFEIPALEFSYFDPDTAQYKTLKSETVSVKIAPLDPNARAADIPSTKPAAKTFNSIRSGAQKFLALSDISSPSLLAHPAFLIFQSFLYIGTFVWLVLRRRQRERDQFLAQYPWEKTAIRMRSQKEWPLFELADIVDQWMRERLCGLLKLPNLYSESHYDDFFAALRSIIHPEKQAVLTELKSFWTELDLLRFSGSKKQNEKMPYKDQYARAQELYAKIEKAHGVGTV